MKELIEAVKLHALLHYEDGGWDVIVECYDDAMFIRHWEIGGEFPTTEEEAIESFRGVVDVMADRQADARHSAF